MITTTSTARGRRVPPSAAPAVRAALATAAPDAILLNVREVAALLGIGLSTAWRDAKSGAIPRPIYLSARAPRWRLADIQALIQRRAA
jgi:predicted DNA-binding transcriptional regulator AlpA